MAGVGLMDPALPSFMQGMAQPGGSIHPAQWEQQAYCYSQPAGACGAIPPLCGGAGTYPSQAWMPPAAPPPPPAPAPPPAPTPGAGAAPPHAAGSAPANVTVDELRTLLNCASVSGATSASRKSFKALSAAEVNELKTKLVKTDIVPFINRLWRKAYRRGEIFRRLHGFWASGTRSQLVADIAAGDSALLEADTWLADAIGSCLDRSAAAVELFFRRPESNDLYAEAQGVTTLLRIAAADATWNGDLDLYGMLLTCFGAAVMHSVKKIGLVVDSSHESEAIASAKAGELVAYAREVLVALGAPPTGPTVILSDNKANVLVANNAKSASRSRHFLRRYHTLQRRMADGECRVVKITDDLMPADFLTKWVPKEKLKRSVDHASNARARAVHWGN